MDSVDPDPFLDVAAEGMLSVSLDVAALLLPFWIGGRAIVAIGRLVGALGRS